MAQSANKVYFFYTIPGTDGSTHLWVTDGSINGTIKLDRPNCLSFTCKMRERKALGLTDVFYFTGIDKAGNVTTEEVFRMRDVLTEERMCLESLAVLKKEMYF